MALAEPSLFTLPSLSEGPAHCKDLQLGRNVWGGSLLERRGVEAGERQIPKPSG